jgi:DNA phosphorothioation-dependent restriction protein DptG
MKYGFENHLNAVMNPNYDEAYVDYREIKEFRTNEIESLESQLRCVRNEFRAMCLMQEISRKKNELKQIEETFDHFNG